MRIIIVLFFLALISCNSRVSDSADTVIAPGQMPNLARDHDENIHIVYGSGDSIMYTFSTDDGQSFSSPSLVANLPRLAASHTRGPQAAFSSKGLIVTACNDLGDIFSYVKEGTGTWQPTGKVNDVDTVAKENLMALGADGPNAFAVWLDLRDKRNKIFGARSTDGGKTWNQNQLIYSSPDSTVCECCKPSVVVKGNQVHVMFRNWLNGNRDLYMISSSDGGGHFGEAEKLGKGSWALKGCPMDGGGIVVNKEQKPETVWRRQGKIYSCEPGKEEKELGEGKGCTMESFHGKNVYAWVENGNVVVLAQGEKKILGKGQLPVLKAVSNEQILCVWEQDKQIHKALLPM